DRLRAVLTASRTAAEAVETLIADRANRLQAALDQREAHDLADARPAAPD
ncbi:MAG: hypothetical protein H7Z10_14245, partial [Gemmatimonadaceae bacterium]|nr:hypothetical protein [Acetobacteraceae bacterium]